MNFSPEWENCYKNHTQLSIWPWSDLVSLVHRYCKHLIRSKGVRVLEIGCGAGANIPLFLALGMEYYAIEGSQTIVRSLHKKYPDLSDRIVIGDFSDKKYFNRKYDLIFDRAAITHNNSSAIRDVLHHSFNSLVPGGFFIGSDWFSKNHTDFQSGEICDDNYTRTNYTSGQFYGVGKVHFSDEVHLRDLFSNFELIFLEEKSMRRFEPKDKHLFSSWNIVAKKTR